MTKNGGRIWAHDWENSGGPAGRKELADRCSLTMSLSGVGPKPRQTPFTLSLLESRGVVLESGVSVRPVT